MVQGFPVTGPVLGFLYILQRPGTILKLSRSDLSSSWMEEIVSEWMPNICPQWALYRGVCCGFAWPQDKTGTWQGTVYRYSFLWAWFVWDRKFNCHSYSTNYCGAYNGQFHAVILFWLCMLTNNGICFSFLIIPTCPYKHFICIITLPVILISGKYWFGQPLIC